LSFNFFSAQFATTTSLAAATATMALWSDYLGVVVEVGLLRWMEWFIEVQRPNSWLGKFFSPPPPFVISSPEYKLLHAMTLAMKDSAASPYKGVTIIK
jgi:hypothetical protein